MPSYKLPLAFYKSKAIFTNRRLDVPMSLFKTKYVFNLGFHIF